jgi:hypothetical protein
MNQRVFALKAMFQKSGFFNRHLFGSRRSDFAGCTIWASGAAPPRGSAAVNRRFDSSEA